MSQNHLLSELNDSVLTLTFNRPDALNAFLPELLNSLEQEVESAKEKGAKVIILQGAGRAFSAGADLKILRGVTPVAGRISDDFDEPGIAAAKALRNSILPVIAKVHGACFTGALELALSCSMIFTTIDTKFGDTHAKFGLRPSWGMTQLLPRAVGMRRAKELSFTGRIFTGEEAAKFGLANEAVADKDALDKLVAERAAQIVENSAPTVAAYTDLFALAALGGSVEQAIAEELRRDYPEITDTEERLAQFK